MLSEYFPSHEENRMKNEGDVEAAREYFLSGKNRILHRLVKQRFQWMNRYIDDRMDRVVELGCGAGLSKLFIKTDKLVLTDIEEHDWVDCRMDANRLDYPDESIDVIICSHMIHHIANPATFLDDLSKKLKPGGYILIQDIYTCLLMKLALRVMRHEGWSDRVDVYDRSALCNDPSDPWSANCSIPKLLFFRGGDRFRQEFPSYRVVERARNECFLFLCSGGVISKTFHLPLGDRGAGFLAKIDKAFIKVAPSIFACGCSVVLQKK